jgi:predicted Zn finger-like uncharacterized protein
MLIVCPSCATSYMIDPASVGAGGRMVRCARCRATWFAGGPESESDIQAVADDATAAKGMIRHRQAVGGGFNSEGAGPDELPQANPDWPQTDAGFAPQARDSDFGADMPQTTEALAFSDSPPLVPPLDHAAAEGTAGAAADSDDIETFAARRKRLQSRRKKSHMSSRWTAIILVLFAFNVALVGARSDVVRFLPQTASLFAAIGLPVNLRHLKFEHVRIARETQKGVTILLVEGSIVSTSGGPVEVPRLRFAARNAGGQEIYTWTAKPERSILGPGESLKFSSSLASPPADAHDVMVRFFNAADAKAAAK